MVLEVVLMVGLGWVEGLEGNDLGNDGLRIDLCGVELGNVGLGNFLLLAVRIENRRAVLRAVVGALVVELSRVVGDGKKDHQNLAVGNLGRIKNYLYGFGVPGRSCADILVVGGVCRAAGVAGSGGAHAFQMLENSLNAPKAAAGDNRGFRGFCRSERSIDSGFRKGGLSIGAAIVWFG